MPLAVKIGPSRHSVSLQPCLVNTDSEPVFVSSEHFEGYITVRIRNHRPASPKDGSQTCSYFDDRSRLFSLQWQGRFMATNCVRHDKLWSANDVLFVAEVEKGVKLPIGLPIAVRFVRLIDPSFIADAISKKKRPWIGSYLVTAMNVLRVWMPVEESAAAPGLDRNGEQNEGISGSRNVGSWRFFGQSRLEEAGVNLLSKTRGWTDHGQGANHAQQQRQSSTGGDTCAPLYEGPMPPEASVSTSTSSTVPVVANQWSLGAQTTQDEGNEKDLSPYQRRRFFMSSQHRQETMFYPDLMIAGDFFNNFTDFETRKARMVVSIRMDRILEDQPLRFVCKSRSRSRIEAQIDGNVDEDDDGEDDVVFFVVVLEWTADVP
ncbi:hypothetical protein BC939DRAFT_490911 [Gamsiella multidivaricata]|uniref:uncharacterized protein n=1 Tax=Gamsiella multidivaricata TaxID=101098 RepID=UPI002220C590|nr:uncharacterized protein BC939DRAFT_490911 [Gamsiella multidivaricata]KAI7828113.1 hypothetical protein BC939DRAFT_490911 [Gamsiella multidivaricata]